jgi:alpha-L-fucosidase
MLRFSSRRAAGWLALAAVSLSAAGCASASGGGRAPAAAASPLRARAAAIERAAARELPAQLRRDVALRRGDTETRARALRWFAATRLGLFVHYGPSSLLAAPSDDAWWRGVHATSYPSVVRRFRPDVTRAVRDWVALAQAARASYLVVTVKHHDGYTLWHSGLGAWGVSRGDDLLAALAPACRRARLPLFLYYSTLDLHEPTYRSGAYLVEARTQLRELLTGYGPVAGVWFDGTWDHRFTDAQLESLYALVHRLQPWALVTTNHHHLPLPGEDYQTFEAGFPGHPPKGWPQTPISPLAHQSAISLGPTWFWDGKDVPRTPARLESLIREARASHTSLLVDIPPRPDGTYGAGVFASVGAASRSVATAPTNGP